MTLQPVGLLLTAALVIAVRLADAWAYRRRVRARLAALMDRDRIAVENRLYREHRKARRRLTPTPGQAVE